MGNRIIVTRLSGYRENSESVSTEMEGLEPCQKHLPSLLPGDLCQVASGHSLISNLQELTLPYQTGVSKDELGASLVT